MKPQDALIAISLARPIPPKTYQDLARGLGISTSESHNGVRRLREAGLVDAQRRVRREVLADFLVHAARISFPATPAALALGVATGAAALDEDVRLPHPEAAPWVWPSAVGRTRGLAIEPLHPGVPEACLADPWLHRALATVDLLRAGGTREVKWARKALESALGLTGSGRSPAVDVSRPDALFRIFSRSKLLASVHKWTGEPDVAPRGQHPLTRAILVAFGAEIADLLATTVPAGRYAPSAPVTIGGSKAGGGARRWVYPTFLDSLVGRRVIDELEPSIRRDDNGRVFIPRPSTISLRVAGEYDASGEEWAAFVRSAVDATLEFAVVLKTDVREFFPSIDQALARQVLAQRTGAHPRVIECLFRCLRAWSGAGGVGGRGLPIEPHGVSRLVAHAVLKTVDDDFEDAFDRKYRRFMDDTVIFVESATAARAEQARYDQVLSEWGLVRNAEKTEVLDAEHYLADLGVPRQERIDAAAGDQALLQGLWLEFAIHESEMARGTERALRRLYPRLRVPLPIEPVLRHVRTPSLRASACRYLRGQETPRSVLTALFQVYDELDDDDARLDLVETLGELRTQDGVMLADWAEERVREPGDGALVSSLLLVLFKHDRAETRIGRILGPTGGLDLSDRMVRATVAYLEAALPGLGPSALPQTPEEAWASRFLSELAEGSLAKVIPAIVKRCLGSRPSFRSLPLAVLLARATTGTAHAQLREVAAHWADPAVSALLAREWRSDG